MVNTAPRSELMGRFQDTSPASVISRILIGKFAAQAMSVAAGLGIADQLEKGALTSSELADRLSCNEDALYRMLRTLASVGIFAERPNRTFANNDVSELLRSNAPGSVRGLVHFRGSDCSWRSWGRLEHSIVTGGPALDEVFGADLFEYNQQNPLASQLFHAAMTNLSVMTAKAVTESYDFSDIGRLVDVGGGHGGLISAITDRFANVQGVLFDRPDVTAAAREHLVASGAADRIEVVSGDFFAGVPQGADAYILKYILHDWDDDRCVDILRACKSALNPGGKVLVVELVLRPGPEGVMEQYTDMEMLVMTPSGKERTEAEYINIFNRAGLKLQRIVPTGSPISPICIIEGVPA